METEELNDLIDRYLNGELPADHPFVRQMEQNEAIRAEVEDVQLVKESVIDYRLSKFKSRIQKHHFKKSENPLKISNYKLWIPVLLLLGSVSSWYLLNTKTTLIKTQETALDKKKEVQKITLEQGSSERNSGAIQSNPSKINSEKAQNSVDDVLTPGSSGSNLLIEVKSANEKSKNNDTVNESSATYVTTGSKLNNENKDQNKMALQANQQSPYIPIKKPNPCDGVKIQASIISKEACRGNNNGSISIEKVFGGAGGYQFSMDNGKSFKGFPKFEYLPSAIYNLIAMDKDQCTSVLDSNYYLGEKECNGPKNLPFNPQEGILEIPRDFPDAGKLTIYEKSGKVVYIKSFVSGEQVSWDGSLIQGVLHPGLYVYYLQYNNNKVEQGNISIIE